ncbi:MAG: hypothetical protein U1F43_35975 [Myxococcota bacterium]
MRSGSTETTSRLFLVGLTFVGLTGLAACGDSGTKTGSDATATAPTDATTASDGTTAADGADTTPGPAACVTADDCATSGAVCSCDGTCVVPTGKACTEDKNCGVPNWCNPCTLHCEPQAEVCEACADSRGCQEGGACLPFASGGSFCGRACVTAAGCPQGYDCQDVGVGENQCVPRSGVCAELGLCGGDDECPIGDICSDATRTCAPGCSEDGQCPGGTNVCVLGRCVAPCSGPGDCTAPATCQSGKCKIPGACESAADCPEKATYCDRTSGSCKSGCQQDADCKDAAQVCKNGSCAAKGCEHNYQCAFGLECEQATGQCKPFPSSVPYCAACDAQAETNPSCPDPNVCVTFKDQNDQEKGDFCLVPCKDDVIDRCPSGWQCNKVQLEEGADPSFLCVRQCYVDPVH